jgi:hypothetical protein
MRAVAAIKFNHDPAAVTHDALKLRRNAAGFSSLPEWRRFICLNPRDSRAAFAVTPTKSNVLTVMASLSSTNVSITLAELRVAHHLKRAKISQLRFGHCRWRGQADNQRKRLETRHCSNLPAL